MNGLRNWNTMTIDEIIALVKKHKHWQTLIEEICHYRNGEVKLTFQDGLPMNIDEIEGKGKRIDLTK